MSDLKKVSLSILLFTFSLLSFLALSTFCTSALATNTKTNDLSSIDIQVDHRIQIKNGGLVFLNDTIRLSTEKDQNMAPLQNFSIGFPYQYKSHLYYWFACDDSDQRLEVIPDVGLGRIGLYGMTIIFPGSGVNISNGGSYNFTVVFVFSNTFISMTYSKDEETATFEVTFPLYPSLRAPTSICNVTVILPPDSKYFQSSFSGYDQKLTFTKTSLQEFTDEPAWLKFYQHVPAETDRFLIFEAAEIKRDITLETQGYIRLSDFYQVTYKAAWNISSITLHLPKGAYDVHAEDELGALSEPSLEEGEATTYINASITPRKMLMESNETKFTVTYLLPWKSYIAQYDWRNFNLAFTIPNQLDWTIKRLTVTLTLPEGAEFQHSSVNPSSVQKSVFQETITYVFYNVTSFHDFDFDLTFGYVTFWASFRPTLWMGILIAVVCAAVFLWQTPKPPPAPIIPVPTEILRGFVDSYKEKRRLLLELESTEQQVRKRKISRRRYKVRRRGLESRVSVLSRELTGLREKIRKAGPRYANTMRQIEAAETELEGAEAAIRRIEIRYRRRELSTETYRRLLAEYNRRREKAKTTIDGVLLRLREEIR